MPRNAFGVYVQPASDVNPPIYNTTIDQVAFAAAITDIATELTNSLDRLGRAPMQAILGMAGFKITNLGAPVATTDAARLADVQSYLGPGAIGFYSQKVPPSGWLVADGSAISRATYAALFAVYNADGLIYGTGDGSTTFNLPNFQGAMLRAWDNGRGYDPGRVFGSYQPDMFASHTHTQTPHHHQYNTVTAAQGGAGVAIPAGAGSLANTQDAIALNQNTGGTETVGKNYAVLVCIRT